MNMLLLHPQDMISQDLALISGRRVKHLIQTQQLEVGKILSAGLINGPLGSVQILESNGGQAQLEVSLNQQPPVAAPLTLILALPRPKYLGRVLQAVTTLGVKSIHLINSFRVEKSFWQSAQLEPGAIFEELVLGLEQARDTLLPEVILHRGFKPFVEDQGPQLVSNKPCLLAHPYSNQSLHSLAPPSTHQQPPHRVLAVGPEGGWIDYEVQKFQELGFQAFFWGERILKLETALIALLSKLQ